MLSKRGPMSWFPAKRTRVNMLDSHWRGCILSKSRLSWDILSLPTAGRGPRHKLRGVDQESGPGLCVLIPLWSSFHELRIFKECND